MHKALHVGDDVDRLYVSRKEKGRGLVKEDNVYASIQQRDDYIKKRSGRRIIATRNNTRINKMEKNGKTKMETKTILRLF